MDRKRTKPKNRDRSVETQLEQLDLELPFLVVSRLMTYCQRTGFDMDTVISMAVQEELDRKQVDADGRPRRLGLRGRGAAGGSLS